jgi:CYTH domain-containing protein
MGRLLLVKLKMGFMNGLNVYKTCRCFPREMLFVVLFFILLSSACQPEATPTTTIPTLKQKVILLDSIQAAHYITTDTQESFFENITPLDMAIQMKRNWPDTSVNRTTQLQAYKTFLKTDVAHFSPQDSRFLSRCLKKVAGLLEQTPFDVLPDTLFLVKTKGHHYGASTFYTRTNGIIIPQYELDEKNEAMMVNVLLHEIFHIYSRNHPHKRSKLYKAIGFEALNLPLQIPSPLQSRILLNPDGVNWKYGINFPLPNDSMVRAIPLIISKKTHYEEDNYFDHLEFQLYPVTLQNDTFHVQVADGWRSPLPPVALLQGFHDQIGDNTAYIIHPDEILADNFVLLARLKNKSLSEKRYSERGLEILEAVETILSTNND